MLRGITVGLGFFGNIHLEGWGRVKGAEIIAAVDKDKERAERTAERYGIKPYTDLIEAIERERPDFVLSDEIESWCWASPVLVSSDEIGFRSVRYGVERYCRAFPA